MRTVHLSYQMPDDEAEALGGTLLGDDAYDLLIAEDCDVYKPNGEPLIKFRRAVLPVGVCKAGYEALREAATETDNRGFAGGEVAPELVRNADAIGRRTRVRYNEKRTDGALSNVQRANIVNSGIVGYFDRNPRFPYCRLTAFNLADNGERFAAAMPFVLAVDRVFREAAPDRYTAQRAIVEQTSPDFYIHGTVFTTITVNKNWQTAVHKDVGDYKPGFGVMSALRAGHYPGCSLWWPAFRVAVDMQTGDVCLADVHEWHGNTPLCGTPGRYERVSCVFYYRQSMIDCGSATEELARAKRRRQGEPLRGRPVPHSDRQ
jgi:hypothetical protein